MEVREKLRLVERWVEIRAAPATSTVRSESPAAVIRRVFPSSECGGIRSLDPCLLARLAFPPSPEPIHPSSLLFLDIETTGLGTGPRCRPFLVGTGRLEGDSFVVTQYFLEDPRAWKTMLQLVRPALEGSRAIVTFNGRHFDWPVLREAYLAIAREDPPPEPAHLDLLRPARKVWRARVGSASLGALECGVLGIRREDDVPGWLVPALYAEYLTSGDRSLADSILSHNLRDILSLPPLLVELARAVTDPSSLEEPQDMLGAARILEEWEDLTAAAAGYEKALRGGLGAEFRAKAVLNLASIYRKQGKVEEWVGLLEEEARGPLRWWAPLHLELSRAYERGRGDLRAAYMAALRALEIVSTDPMASGPERAGITEEIVRRLDRLEERIRRG